MMREVSFVEKIVFDFNGNIAKNALVIGDADNDQCNELVCANLQGDLAIFKERNSNCWARSSNLGMVTACAVGDITNVGKNHVIAINTEGWLYIFDANNLQPISPTDTASTSTSTARASDLPNEQQQPVVGISINEQQQSEFTNAKKDTQLLTATDQPSGSTKNGIDNGGGEGVLRKSSSGSQENQVRELFPYYEQRMPANARVMLLADLDGDKLIELIIGLTDRVLRTYRWIKIGENKGKFVGIYKWEFADQIGAVSLNTSHHEGCQDIIVAQPGGTYAKLECIEKKSAEHGVHRSSSQTKLGAPTSHNASSTTTVTTVANPTRGDIGRTFNDDDNVQTEYISKLTPEYHQLALAQMRNPHISTEILGGIRGSAIAGSSMKKSIFSEIENHKKQATSTTSNEDNHNTNDIRAITDNDHVDDDVNKSHESISTSLIVISTIDGTLMLVNKDEVLWSIQVDHQLFALDKLEIPAGPATTNTGHIDQHIDEGTKNGTSEQYLIACAWDGKTYIVDEDRNYLRFKFSEAVSSFAAGNYYFDDKHHASLIYATFNNQIILYYDVELSSIKPRYLLDEIMNNPEHSDLLADLAELAAHRTRRVTTQTTVTVDNHSSERDQEASVQFVRCPTVNSDLIKQVLFEILYSNLPS